MSHSVVGPEARLSGTMWRLGLVGLAGLAVGLAAEWVGGPQRAWPMGPRSRRQLDLHILRAHCRLEASGKPYRLAIGCHRLYLVLGNFAEVRAAAITWLSAHAVYLHRGPLVHLLLTCPSGRSRSRLTRGAIAVGYAVATITPIWRNDAATIILAATLVVVCAYDCLRSIGWLWRARRIALQAATGLSLVLAGTATARMLVPAGDASVLSLVLYEQAERHLTANLGQALPPGSSQTPGAGRS